MNTSILNQILSTILRRNVWRSVWRICLWILGLKGIKDSNLGVAQALLDLSWGLTTAASACGVSQRCKVVIVTSSLAFV